MSHGYVHELTYPTSPEKSGVVRLDVVDEKRVAPLDRIDEKRIVRLRDESRADDRFPRDVSSFFEEKRAARSKATVVHSQKASVAELSLIEQKIDEMYDTIRGELDKNNREEAVRLLRSLTALQEEEAALYEELYCKPPADLLALERTLAVAEELLDRYSDDSDPTTKD